MAGSRSKAIAVLCLSAALLGGSTARAAGLPHGDPNAPERLSLIESSDDAVRVVIELREPAVATHLGASALGTDGGPDFAAPAFAAYEAQLAVAQEALVRSLAGAAPAAEVQHRYRLAFNGIAARVPGTSLAAIRRLPGVAGVTVARRHYPQMDASLPLIGLVDGAFPGGVDAGRWAQLGGHLNAGAGIRIANIDSGIDPTHRFFDPAGFSYPRGFPKGDATLTTP